MNEELELSNRRMLANMTPDQLRSHIGVSDYDAEDLLEDRKGVIDRFNGKPVSSAAKRLVALFYENSKDNGDTQKKRESLMSILIPILARSPEAPASGDSERARFASAETKRNSLTKLEEIQEKLEKMINDAK